MWSRRPGPPYQGSAFMECPPFPHNDFFQPSHSRMGQQYQSFNQPYSGMSMERPARSVNCGELRVEDAGVIVEIAGVVHDIRSGRFLVLKDAFGFTQCVAPDDRSGLQKRIENMPIGSYVVCRGEVVERPYENKVQSKPTGSIEVVVEEFIKVQIKRKRDDKDGGNRAKRNKSGPLLTTEEAIKAKNSAMRSYFLARSHRCADVCSDLIAQELTLCGWINVKRNFNFLGFKDGSGELQLVTNDESKGVMQMYQDVGHEVIVFVRGVLANRPSGKENTKVANGRFELVVTEIIRLTEDIIPAVVPCGDDGTHIQPPLPPDPVPEGVIAPRLNDYTWRTHTCGELRSCHVGQSVVLVGWVEFKRMTKFLLLRDSYGSTQILVSDSDGPSQQIMDKVDFESVVMVVGTVCARPEPQIKHDKPTGEIEVLVTNMTVLNEAEALPFQIRDFKKVNEPLRIEYRYLDLRSQEMQRNLRLRSSVLMKMREFLINRAGFIEVETPTLFKRTPGGAREFIVPTHNPGHFYSLVQSPQQLKQMLMVGGVDRYFQVARCYRDESTRPDRQPEFTQLDIELSFCRQDGVIQLVEDLIKYCWPLPNSIAIPFSRITYAKAMETYGIDKPDLRFGWELINMTEAFVNGCPVNSKLNIKEKINQYSHNFAAYSFVVSSTRGSYLASSKSKFESELKKSFPNVTLLVTSTNKKDYIDNLNHLLGDRIASSLLAATQPNACDCIVTSIGSKDQVLQCLGKARLLGADMLENAGEIVRSTSEKKFVWVTDFPLFTNNEAGQLESNHHPFTAPQCGQEGELFTNPLQVCGQHYDLVLNGCEIAGGSIRIEKADVQEKVLKDLLKIDVQPLKHLLSALKSGAPPHGGIALGIDRLIAIMAGTTSIKDVIAFPKSIDGKDPLSGAPCAVSQEELRYYNIKSSNDN